MSAVDLSAQLGHLARRLQQANTALWHALVSEETTSPQFAVLNAVASAANTDQRMVGEMIGLDRSTTASRPETTRIPNGSSRLPSPNCLNSPGRKSQHAWRVE
jgi:hypothetical protein